AVSMMTSAPMNMGRMTVRLKPRDERKLSADQIINELRPKMSKVPGGRMFLTNPPALRIGGFNSRSQYVYKLQGQNFGELYRAAANFENVLRRIPGLTDVNSDLQIASPQVMLDIDRDRASALGINASQVENALYDAYGSRQVSSIYTPTNDYQVIMELMPKYQ